MKLRPFKLIDNLSPAEISRKTSGNTDRYLHTKDQWKTSLFFFPPPLIWLKITYSKVSQYLGLINWKAQEVSYSIFNHFK